MYAIFLHAHQKIDRVARRHIIRLAPGVAFPSIGRILHFEGKRGPDSVKLKQPGVEQPWHFINPDNDGEQPLYETIQAHFEQLVGALTTNNETRSAFEAAWLAHALVDGLTPAHHYPYEEALEELRGSGRGTRKGLVGRAIVQGDSPSDSIKKSLQLLGPKGLLTTHTMFEGGAFSIILPLRLNDALPSAKDIATIERRGIVRYFATQVEAIHALGMYDTFYKTGWTPQLARTVRRELAPRMVRTVTLAWYEAARLAGRL